MNVGKTLFAQIMEFVPWTSFGRIVDRYGGNSGVRRLSCAEQFRVMAFAHLGRRSRLVDQARTQTLQQHRLGRFGSEERCVCVGRNDDRPLFEPVRLGAISQSKGCRFDRTCASGHTCACKNRPLSPFGRQILTLSPLKAPSLKINRLQRRLNVRRLVTPWRAQWRWSVGSAERSELKTPCPDYQRLSSTANQKRSR